MKFRGLYTCKLLQGAVIMYGTEGSLDPLDYSYQLLGVQFNSAFLKRIEGVETYDIPIYVVPACSDYYSCEADHTLYFTLDNRKVDPDYTLRFGFNNIYTKHLTNFSLLNMKSLIDESDIFCNKDKAELLGWQCETNFCECPHLISLPTLNCIEMIFLNKNEEPHPLHLHGYTFYVLQQGILTLEELQNVSFFY